MAVKTITIDIEAYELLSKARTANESFSTVIKQALGPAGKNAQALLSNLENLHASPSFLDALERTTASRNDDLLAAEPLAVYKG